MRCVNWLLAACLGFYGLLSPTLADDGLTTTQKQQVEKLIADYLLNNPEALGDALDNMQSHYQQLEADRKKQALRNNAQDLYFADGDFSMGPPDAPITIVEFFDYNCGYCKRAFDPLMQVVQENNDVRLVFKELPILNEASRRAAQIALALGDQLKFLTFHTKLMTHKGPINDAFIDRTVKDLKLSLAELEAAGARDGVQTILRRNERLASLLGIGGTPAFIINDTIYPGAISKDEMDAALNQARLALKTAD